MTIKLQGELEKSKGIYYELDSSAQLLGEGGTGKVFRGRQVTEATGEVKDVAIKFMYSDLPENIIERARREAEIKIKSDNLVEMMGFFEIEEQQANNKVVKRYHVVSELLIGVTLEDLMHGKTTDSMGNEIPFAQSLYKEYINDPYRFSLFVLKNVLSGLMALHDAGYIHRDIDPTNIMITSDEHVKLIDFGIAKQLKQLNTYDKSLTSAGVFIGKASYAAPEMVLGDIKNQSKRTDTYSAGILLYQCLVGHLPFEGADNEILAKQLKEKVPLNQVKQTAIRKVIAKATAKKQEERYQTAAEFRVALEKIADLPYPEKGIALKKYGKILLAAIVVCIVVVIALNTLGGNNEGKSETTTEETKSEDRPLTYADILDNLRNPAKAATGLKQLDSLVNKGDAEATYLKSRILFLSNTANDYRPDSIKTMQEATKVSANNVEAHKLLLKTISLNPNDYRALYELGCDHLGGSSRTNAVERDIDKADEYFTKALKAAQAAKDVDFVRSISEQMAKYK